MGKPVVTFDTFAGIIDRNARIAAVLEGVRGHPILGDERVVYTSRVERIGYDDAGEVVEIETRNTIYQRAVE